MYECPECGKECQAVPEDQGYGKGEFWGVPYNDIRMCMVSDCCEVDISDQISYAEWKYDKDCDYADYMHDCKRDEELERQWEKEH
jgi:hypothetical protein